MPRLFSKSTETLIMRALADGEQLSFFKGKKPPPALEFATCCALNDLITRSIAPGWDWTHLPFGEHRDHKINPRTGQRYSPTGARLKRLGTKKGWPDYLFVGPERGLLALEMKRSARGKLSEAQIAVGEHFRRCGFDWVCVSSFEQAVEVLSERDIIRGVRMA